jgi:chromosome segregation ATPase
MPLLKDTEREQLRQLVKACLLEISKLKIELKKCQNESLKSRTTESIQFKAVKDEVQNQLSKKNEEIKQIETKLDEKNKKLDQLKSIVDEKNEEINQLKSIVDEKSAVIKEFENIKTYFKALTEKPKKDLTSFQSQIYQVLPEGEDTENNLYFHINEIGFTELSRENFAHALRNLERKGYFESRHNNGENMWKKIDR